MERREDIFNKCFILAWNQSYWVTVVLHFMSLHVQTSTTVKTLFLTDGFKYAYVFTKGDGLVFQGTVRITSNFEL